ncbi:MAG: serine hydrolase domain-containing protein [Terriglobales bacterium]
MAQKLQCLFLAVALSLGALYAQQTKPASTAPQLTASDLDAFFSGLMNTQLQQDQIPGATLAVVQNGKVIFEHGYGFANRKQRTPVLPAATLFRPGSISKLFTWTAVMQLVQAGKINLDANVNQYLDFTIPATYPGPVTMRDLMTHRPGFEEADRGLILMQRPGLVIPPLARVVREHLPQRIFPAGSMPAYSNYGAALAGYIVQRVSGEPFASYIETHILQPLAMNDSSFQQPLPARLRPMAATAYRTSQGPAMPYEIVPMAPAGAFATTADDMTHFMIAQLGDGTYNHGPAILTPATLAEMHTPQPGLPAGIDAMDLGFYHEDSNGLSIIGHGGDTIFFHSDLHLIPSADLGLFVSYDGVGGARARSLMWQAFLDRYFPYHPPAVQPVPSAAVDSRTVAGTYITTRRSQGNWLAAMDLLSESTVVANRDHTISLANHRAVKYAEIGPMLFQRVHGQAHIAFRRDASGRWVMYTSPIIEAQRTGVFNSIGFDRPLVEASLAVLFLTLFLWIVAPAVRLRFRVHLALRGRARTLRLLVRLACLLDVVFVLGILMLLTAIGRNPAVLNATGTIHFLQVLGVLGVVGALAGIGYAVELWRGRPAVAAASAATASASSPSGSLTMNQAPPVRTPFGWLGRVSWTVTALAMCGFAWFALYWSLLNFTNHF